MIPSTLVPACCHRWQFKHARCSFCHQDFEWCQECEDVRPHVCPGCATVRPVQEWFKLMHATVEEVAS